MDTTNAPQIIEHLSKSLTFTPFDTKWIPQTSKFVLFGETPKAKGVMHIYSLSKKELQLTQEKELDRGVKSSVFTSYSPLKQELNFVDFGGNLQILDIETNKIIFKVKAHENMINCIDAMGGEGYGPIELATGGRDGCVRIWDPRQQGPVVSLEPVEKEPAIPDCWCVGFGNSYNNEERHIASGYDNGDLKFFDLKTNQLIWDTNVQNGICGLEYDRKDIIMNKLVCTTLEGKFNVFDLRTLHVEAGFAQLTETGQKSTIWGVKHLPQNREIFLTQGGNGALNIYQYHYPKQRMIKDSEDRPKGVIGSVELLNSRDISTQPISSYDWNKDKIGLACLCALDQTVKVMFVTKLNLY